MEIFDNLDRIRRDSNNVITVGTFDGLHLGHQYIFNELKQTATQVEGIPTVVTFNPHPQIVLAAPDKPPIKILTTIEQKIELIRRQDIQKLIIIPFTLEFSRLSSEEYVNRILYQTIGLKGIVIGYDHAFGKGREGGIHTLTQIGQEKHFFIKKLSPFMLDGQVISSSLIRQLISRGEVEQANRFLGHPYRIMGEVVQGDGRGKTLGFPTANIRLVHANQLLPQDGVYAVDVIWQQRQYLGMANIGLRPTFNGAHKTIEVHLFDFDQDLYGEKLEMGFYQKIREEVKFRSAAELQARLQKDKEESMTYFKLNAIRR